MAYIYKKRIIVLILLLVVTSLVTSYVSYRSGLATVYNDAMTHLNIGRAVLDGKQPGLAQLGSVWLPLNHILELSLVWNDWAWHSGFAGSFFSMISYIFSAIGIYKIVRELTENFWASVLGALTFALNPNILYLQTTPMTEPLYLALFIFSALYVIKFIKTNELKYLLLMGFFGMLQVLMRYDGWFVVGVEGIILIYQQIRVAKITFQECLGKLLVFAIPIIFAASLWLLWNALIFGSPLYFMFGPYSAHAQQSVIQNGQGLPTKDHLLISLLAYWYAIQANIGNYVLALSTLGTILFLVTKSKWGGFENKSMVVLMLFSPLLFNVIALYLGFSILNLPQLHYQLSIDFSQEYFNVRYGILALPLVAVGVGCLSEKLTKKTFLIFIASIITAQAWFIYQQGIVTIMDGVLGSGNVAPVAAVLSANVAPNQNILISSASFSAVIFRSGFSIKDFITEGDSAIWKEAMAEPQNYADWVVMGNGDPNDGVYVGVYEKNPEQFLKHYIKVYCNLSTCVYKKRTAAETFVYADGTNLKIDGDDFTMRGVNSYDLAYQSTSTIDATFKNLSSIGVNTVRFWMFGDGNSDGFQPTSGIPNEIRFKTADYAIADAANYNIRLIPVLVNNWTDYGGEQQYLKWTGQNPNDQDLFYTNPEAIALFENYINHVIPRKNTVNGISYNDDPTIMAWEIVNEPRWSEGHGQEFVTWFAKVATYIRQEDPNHMITVETNTTSVQANGALDINDNCSALSVDFCTAHLYLYNNNEPIYNDLSTVKLNLNDYIKIADQDKKPFILGEVGVSKTMSPFGMQPLTVLKDIATANSGSGVLIWNWSQKPDTSYGFSPNGTDGVYTLADLSNVLGGIEPSTVYLATSSPTGGYAMSLPGQGPATTSTQKSSIGNRPSIISKPSSTPFIVSQLTTTATTTPDIVSTSTIAVASSSVVTTTTSQPLLVEKILPYSTEEMSIANWIDGWGGSTVANGMLTVGSNAQNTSGGIFLNGSNSWQDYRIMASVDWIKGELFTLIARRSDSNNYLQCVFSYNDNVSEHVDINRIWNNQSEPIAHEATISNWTNNISISNMEVFMQVYGNVVKCGINNATVINDINIGLPPILSSGGIGFTTWDPIENNSEIIVKGISVTYPQ